MNQASRETEDSSTAVPASRTPINTPIRSTLRMLQLNRRLRPRSGISVTVAFIWLALLVVVALTVQWLPLHSDLFPAGHPNELPHWGADFLGTDSAGRSNLSRVLFGARISLMISVLSTSISLVVGGLLGLVSAHFGPPVSTIGEIIANTILSIPSLLLLLAIVLALSPSIPVIIVASSVVFIPAVMRLTRANATGELTKEYIGSARGLGASAWRIIFRELVPNTAPSMISYVALVLPAVMIVEGSLSFLGFGVQTPTPSWGNMIAFAYPNISIDPWPAIFPCVCLSLTVFSLNTVGDYVRNKLTLGGGK